MVKGGPTVLDYRFLRFVSRVWRLVVPRHKKVETRIGFRTFVKVSTFLDFGSL